MVQVDSSGGLTAPIADTPPAGAYKTGGILAGLSIVKVIAVCVVLAVVGTTVGVVMSTRSGATVVASDSVSGGQSPSTQAPTPFPASSYAPTSPTPRPTVDVDSTDIITTCAQDVAMYIDVSGSITKGMESLERQFGQTMIDMLFNHSADADSIHVAIKFFAGRFKPDKDITFGEDASANNTALDMLLNETFGTGGYTKTWKIFEDVLSIAESPPDNTNFNSTTGRGLSLILLSDGAPNVSDEDALTINATEDTMAARDNLLAAFPSIKVYCFSPKTLGDKATTFYEGLCDGYWYIGDETVFHDAATAAISVVSKVCSNTTISTRR